MKPFKFKLIPTSLANLGEMVINITGRSGHLPFAFYMLSLKLCLGEVWWLGFVMKLALYLFVFASMIPFSKLISPQNSFNLTNIVWLINWPVNKQFLRSNSLSLQKQIVAVPRNHLMQSCFLNPAIDLIQDTSYVSWPDYHIILDRLQLFVLSKMISFLLQK